MGCDPLCSGSVQDSRALGVRASSLMSWLSDFLSVLQAEDAGKPGPKSHSAQEEESTQSAGLFESSNQWSRLPDLCPWVHSPLAGRPWSANTTYPRRRWAQPAPAGVGAGQPRGPSSTSNGSAFCPEASPAQLGAWGPPTKGPAGGAALAPSPRLPDTVSGPHWSSVWPPTVAGARALRLAASQVPWSSERKAGAEDRDELQN